MYNGKELNSDFGLDWYAYGFRYYDAAIGRFPSVDPIADKFPHVSPYNYAENRVPNGIDLWGLQFLPLPGGIENKMKDMARYNGVELSNGKANCPTCNIPLREGNLFIDGGNALKSGGDKIEKVGLGVAVVAPPIGVEIAATGAGIQLLGHGLVVGGEMQANGELSPETKTDAVIDGIFMLTPKPLEMLVEKSGIDEVAQGYVKAQVNAVNEAVKETTKAKVNEHNSFGFFPNETLDSTNPVDHQIVIPLIDINNN